MADLFQDYPLGSAWDEMFAAPDRPREAVASVHDTVRALAVDELRARADALALSFLDRGVTFALGGEERPFPLDIVPRIITAAEWAMLSAGVAQRVRALEAFLADVYDSGRVFDDGVIPKKLIATSAHFHRAAADVVPANGVRVLVSGIDVIRDQDGQFRVLEDNIRVPSGVSYVIENRRAMTHGLPEAFASHRIMPVSDYPQRLLAAARAAAPDGPDADAEVVVLTPGVYNSAYFEHALLARHDGRRTGRGPRPGVPAQPGLHAHHERGEAGRRHLPPHRRRLPRPAALPGRLHARLPGPARTPPGTAG